MELQKIIPTNIIQAVAKFTAVDFIPASFLIVLNFCYPAHIFAINKLSSEGSIETNDIFLFYDASSGIRHFKEPFLFCFGYSHGNADTLEELTGAVKWFSNQKDYGFITPDNGSKDVFVHHSAIVGEGYKTLAEGQKVKFQISNTEKGDQASNVTKI